MMKKIFFILFCLNTLNSYAQDPAIYEVKLFSKEAKKKVNLYAKLPITQEEEKSIRYILDTLSQTPALFLIAEKPSLEAEGRKVKKVHILRFLGTIFTDKTLTQEMKKIKASSFKWPHFSEGLKKSLSRHAKENDLTPYVPGFCECLGVSEKEVMALLETQNWDGFLNFLVSTLK